MAKLTEKERIAVVAHGEGVPLSTTAEQLGVSRERVRQIRERGMAKLLEHRKPVVCRYCGRVFGVSPSAVRSFTCLRCADDTDQDAPGSEGGKHDGPAGHR
jgi:intracellular sulfur oxidation DsrE/DsrF family protein